LSTAKQQSENVTRLASSTVESFFLDGQRGALFGLLHRPHTLAQGTVLIVPPFAEEMNKSRRMFTLLAGALAQHGFGTMVFDLYGTGDSSGDFADARWSDWCHDLTCAVSWLTEHVGPNYSLLGVRLGALLALDTLRGPLAARPNRLLLWQPVVSGQQYLRQFLRLRIAAGMNSEGTGRESASELRAQWDSGGSLEIAGYEVAAELAKALDELTLAGLVGPDELSIDWFEIVSNNPQPSPASTRAVAAATAAGAVVDLTCVAGQPFWTLQEITVVPELIDATCTVLDRYGRA
jgi:exosortase A-associated hydrolase 2